MKRVWIGGGLLVVLLIGGLLLGTWLTKRLPPMAEDLNQAGIAAQRGDWTQAERLTARVAAEWEKMDWLTAAVTGHEELEDIDDAFAQLPAYAWKDATGYHAICATIAQEIIALAENHICNWRNFL